MSLMFFLLCFEAPTSEAFHASREGAALGVSRIRRTATQRRSLALAASHAGTCDTGIFKRPVRGGSAERNDELKSLNLNCATEQHGWTEIYAVHLSRSLMRAG